MTQYKNKLNQQIRRPEDSFINSQNRAIYEQGRSIVRKKRSLLCFILCLRRQTHVALLQLLIHKKKGRVRKKKMKKEKKKKGSINNVSICRPYGEN